MNKIILLFKRLKRRIAIWFFVRSIGKVSRAYAELTKQSEKMDLLTEAFGREWYDVIDVKNSNDESQGTAPSQISKVTHG